MAFIQRHSEVAKVLNNSVSVLCVFIFFRLWQFLIRQSCAISVESSSQFLTHVVMGIEDVLNDYILHMSELANLYEDSVMAITEEGAER